MTMGHHMLLCGCILTCLCANFIYGAIRSFSITEGQKLQGNSIKIVCQLTEPISVIYIYKTPTKEINDAQYLAACGFRCASAEEQLYNVTKTERAITVTVMNLQRTADQRWWTCISPANEKKQFYLTVYTEPTFLNLSSVNCDLAYSKCTLTCTTSCMYPRPSFSWQHSDTAFFKEYDDGVRVYMNMTSSCSEWEGQATELLILSRYMTLPENIDRTVVFICSIPHFLSEGVLESNVSGPIRFAVQVRQVRIYSEQNVLPPDYKVIVTENIETSLRCIAGASRPLPMMTLHIGKNYVVPVTGDKGTFIPSNSHHDVFAYCEAKNFIGTGTTAATSNKVRIYVKVPIKSVEVVLFGGVTLNVILEMAEPVTCKTDGGRPESTITWYKIKNGEQHVLGQNINITSEEKPVSGLQITKSTVNFIAALNDVGSELSCSAMNLADMKAVYSNKTLNIMYPPKNMSLLFDGKAITGPLIDLIKGTSGTLSCTASSNPPVSVFSWNINKAAGDTFAIDNSIQNDQIVNCTARNIMKSTAGITMNGYGSISKKINLQYGAIIETILVNGNANPVLVIKEKDPITIACYVDSNPDSTISLYQGIERLTESAQSTELFYNISSAQCSDSSQYTCIAGNGITNVEQPAVRTVQINVECSPRLAFGVNSFVIAKENTTAVLSLTVLAYPKPTHYYWYRNMSNRWEELINTTSFQMTYETVHLIHTRFDLRLVHVKPEDYGEYKLIVDNDIGAPLCFTFVLQSLAVPVNTVDNNKIDGSTLAAVAGALGTVLVIVIAVVVILVLIIWRNHINIKCHIEDNLAYEMPNIAPHSSTDRTYDIVDQRFSEYENAAP